MGRRLSAAGRAIALASVLALAAERAAAARPAELALVHQRIEVDGVPIERVGVDFDRDGLRDLVLVAASTRWGEIGVDEAAAVDDSGVFVEVLTVVPALLDRRELAIHRGLVEGGFASEPLRLELPATVHAVEAGPAEAPLLAWTDDGVSEVVAAAAGGLELAPRIAARTLFAGSSSFVLRPGLAHDLDGDGRADLLVPRAGGLAVHLSGSAGLGPEPVAVVAVPLEERLPGDARHYRNGASRHVPLPDVRDLDGDRLPELLFRNHERGWNQLRVLANRGGGRFGAPVDPVAGRARDAEPEVVALLDLDGDGRAELVTAEPLGRETGSLRAGLAQARRPRVRFRVHELGPGLVWRSSPRAQLELEGYVLPGEGGQVGAWSGVRDLDGDGRLDLIAVTLDFSVFEALRVMAARSLRIRLDFEIWRQEAPLTFRRVPGLDLAGDLRLRLDRLALGQLSSFAGDFDGDGRADFIQLGRGRKVTIHRGLDGARYAGAPDFALELEREPVDAALIAVEDLDGDGRSDLLVPHPAGEGDLGRRAVVDLYLSRGASR